jgi:hypothetical protein
MVSMREIPSVLTLDNARAAPALARFVGQRGAGGAAFGEAELRALRVVESASRDATAEVLGAGDAAGEFGRASLALFSCVSDAAALRYVLQVVEDALLEGLAAMAGKLFGSGRASPQSEAGELRFSPLVRLVEHEDEGVSSQASYVSALLFSVSSPADEAQRTERTHVLEKVVATVEAAVAAEAAAAAAAGSGAPSASPSSSSAVTAGGARGAALASALQTLAVLLRLDAVRNSFVARGGAALMVRATDHFVRSGRADINSQYQCVLSLWLTAFSAEAAAALGPPDLAVLAAVLRGEPATRIARVVLSTVRIALSAADEDHERRLSQALIELQLPKVLAAVGSKKQITGADPELLEDLQWLTTTLLRNFKVLTTFERHRQELLSKKLSWSMVHEDIFWKENALKFEDDNFNSVKLLVEMLKAEDVQTVAVACSDIGFFVQYFPQGKLVVDKYGGKALIMALLGHQNPDVRKHALAACSKIMISNWQAFRA